MKSFFSKLSISYIKKRIDKIKKSKNAEASIFKNMAKLTAGTGLAKIIGVLTAPVITRIYLPEDFGVLSIFTSVIALIVPLGTLRYSLALPLPKNDGLATNIAVLSIAILLTISSFTFLLLYFSNELILSFFNVEKLIPFWWLIPVGVIGTGLYEILTNWAIREKAYKQYATTIFWQSIIGSVTKIGLGMLGLKPLGLLIGEIFNQAGGILSLFRKFYSRLAGNFKYITKNRIIFLSKRYADFPKYRLPAQFLLVLATKTPLLFFAWHFGIAETGQLGLTFSMLAIPMRLFGTTTANAFYGEIARIGKTDSDKIYNITKAITKRMFLVSIFPFIVLLIGGPWLFSFFFGQEWREAGIYASILALYLLTQFIYSPVGNGVFNVFEKQSLVLGINSIRLLLIGIVFLITFIFSFSTYIALALYSIILSLYYIITILIVFKIIKSKKRN